MSRCRHGWNVDKITGQPCRRCVEDRELEALALSVLERFRHIRRTAFNLEGADELELELEEVLERIQGETT